MYTLFIQVSEETSKSAPYNLGYAVGHFVGSHFLETAIIATLLTSAVVYFLVKKWKKRNDWI